eukprot:m.153016 g.153016  ORF g.153016 m.153016 type:complete len:580 (+) comp24573_c0_seq1:90-1829(+)
MFRRIVLMKLPPTSGSRHLPPISRHMDLALGIIYSLFLAGFLGFSGTLCWLFISYRALRHQVCPDPSFSCNSTRPKHSPSAFCYRICGQAGDPHIECVSATSESTTALFVVPLVCCIAIPFVLWVGAQACRKQISRPLVIGFSFVMLLAFLWAVSLGLVGPDFVRLFSPSNFNPTEPKKQGFTWDVSLVPTDPFQSGRLAGHHYFSNATAAEDSCFSLMQSGVGCEMYNLSLTSTHYNLLAGTWTRKDDYVRDGRAIFHHLSNAPGVKEIALFHHTKGKQGQWQIGTITPDELFLTIDNRGFLPPHEATWQAKAPASMIISKSPHSHLNGDYTALPSHSANLFQRMVFHNEKTNNFLFFHHAQGQTEEESGWFIGPSLHNTTDIQAKFNVMSLFPDVAVLGTCWQVQTDNQAKNIPKKDQHWVRDCALNVTCTKCFVPQHLKLNCKEECNSRATDRREPTMCRAIGGQWNDSACRCPQGTCYAYKMCLGKGAADLWRCGDNRWCSAVRTGASHIFASKNTPAADAYGHFREAFLINFIFGCCMSGFVFVGVVILLLRWARAFLHSKQSERMPLIQSTTP